MYSYLFGVGLVMAFLDAYGIGANDVANSFATSVGSGSLSLKAACCIAVFTEFGGAVLLGNSTADTIRGKIIRLDVWVNTPYSLQLAMVCALVGSATWILFATKQGWPVSTTHSIVGAIVGVGIAAFGTDSVKWGFEDGVLRIVVGWLLSPILAGIASSIIFLLTKYIVLDYNNSLERGLRAIPVYFGLTTALNIFYIVFKGSPGLKLDKKPLGAVMGITWGISAFVALFCWFLVATWLRRRLVGEEDLKWYQIFYIPFVPKQPVKEDVEGGMRWGTQHEAAQSVESIPHGDSDTTAATNPRAKTSVGSIVGKVVGATTYGINKEVRNYKSKEMKEMHDLAPKYNNRTEYLYSFLQVVTACFASFAHGSNDVANAVGPLSVIYYIYDNAKIDAKGKTPVPIWILAFGGLAIDVGLMTYGYHIMRSLGNNLTYHSPSRGFSMELGAALTVVTASKFGFPVSTTHCITGATAAVGLANNVGLKALNWKMLTWCFISWALTLPVAGTIAGLLFAFVNNAPTTGPR